MKYVRNAWYPLGWAEEIGRELSRHMVLEEAIVVYRREDGKIAALLADDDRAPQSWPVLPD